MNIPRPELMHIFMLVFLAWIFVDKIFRLSQGKMAQPFYLLIVWYGTIFYSVVDHFRLDLTIFYRGREAISCLFLALFALGSFLRFKAGRELSKAPGEDQLVCTGPFYRIRHPEYTAFLIQLVSIPLAFGSWGGCLTAVLTGLPLTLAAIRNKEQEDEARFPGPYSEYKNKTKRLLPLVW